MIIKYSIQPKTEDQYRDIIDYFSDFLEAWGIDNWKCEVEDGPELSDNNEFDKDNIK